MSIDFAEKERSIHAEVICDSINEAGHRLTTFVCTYPRWIHSEIMTHRAATKSSASSRAIPVARMKAKIERYPAFPSFWGAEQAGMQTGDFLQGEDLLRAKRLFEDVHQGTLASLDEYLEDLKLDFIDADERKKHTLHKSLLNRLTEPFMWITVIITATEWENFYRQRVSPLAEPHFNDLATKMRKAQQESEPRLLLSDNDEWHLPFITDEERKEHSDSDLIPWSVARSARVSYLNHDGTYSEAKDLELFKRLCDPGEGPPHAAPLEHIATPDPGNSVTILLDRLMSKVRIDDGQPGEFERSFTVPLLGNFLGWTQFRHIALGF